MTTVAELIPRIEAYCLANDIAETTFGRLAVNDGKLVERLKTGKSITLNTLQQIETTLAAQPRTRRASAAAEAP